MFNVQFRAVPNPLFLYARALLRAFYFPSPPPPPPTHTPERTPPLWPTSKLACARAPPRASFK